MATRANNVIDAAKNEADVLVSGGGTVYLLHFLTPAAEEWCDAHIDVENSQWLGRGLAVEHRYVGDIIEGLLNDGLEVR